jgi:CDP-diacylglycerol--glycerol-3-phosphate 3-phosphatidyltransferase
VLARSTLPNLITVGRAVLAPIVMLLIFVPSFAARLVAFVLFLAAAFSDLWDGWLARRHGWVSDFGKLVDPIADKLLLIATFLAFHLLGRSGVAEAQLPLLGALPVWVLCVVFGRELLVTVIRSVAARGGVVIPAGSEGKLKAVFQNVFIGTTIFWIALHTAAGARGWHGVFWDFWRGFHGFVLIATLCLAVLLTVWSLLVYLWQWRRSVGRAGA